MRSSYLTTSTVGRTMIITTAAWWDACHCQRSSRWASVSASHRFEVQSSCNQSRASCFCWTPQMSLSCNRVSSTLMNPMVSLRTSSRGKDLRAQSRSLSQRQPRRTYTSASPALVFREVTWVCECQAASLNSPYLSLTAMASVRRRSWKRAASIGLQAW